MAELRLHAIVEGYPRQSAHRRLLFRDDGDVRSELAGGPPKGCDATKHPAVCSRTGTS